MRSRIRELRELETNLAERLVWAHRHLDPACIDREGCDYVRLPVTDSERTI